MYETIKMKKKFLIGILFTIIFSTSALNQEQPGANLTPLGLPPEIVRAKFPDSEGKKFFNQRVMPQLAVNGCQVCHMPGAGYVRPEISYDGLLPFLAIGQASDNNVVIFKIANQRSFAPNLPNHPGGKRCEDEDAEPCKSVKAWWEVEFGEDKEVKSNE